MKPLVAEEQDGVTLQDLGRASLQIIHDIKNQLNGLKLYATFLRKRMERIELAAEEQETISKLIVGLDRAAADLTVLVQYGRPLQLQKQRGVDLQKLLRNVASALPNGGNAADALVIDPEAPPAIGEFDPTALTDALMGIARGALRAQNRDDQIAIQVRLYEESSAGNREAVIEGEPVSFNGDNPFRSFNGSQAIRMSLAARIIEAHGGAVDYDGLQLRIRLPLTD